MRRLSRPCGPRGQRGGAAVLVVSLTGVIPAYGAEAIGAAIESANELGAYSSDYIVNLLEQRARRLPEPGPLHLTRAPEALELELPAPDLTPYNHDQRHDL